MSGTGHTTKSVPATGDQRIDGLLSGVAWADGTIYYSFPTSNAEYDYGTEKDTFSPVTSAMKTAAHFALNANLGPAASACFSVEGFTGLNIVRTTATKAHIRLAQSDDPTTAWAYYPSTSDSGGDVWFGKLHYDYTNPVAGNYPIPPMPSASGRIGNAPSR